MNGDKYKTGKLTPEGLPDPSVFSTEKNREGIQVGTAVALLVRDGAQSHQGEVHFRQHWGNGKPAEMHALGTESCRIGWHPLVPTELIGLPLTPSAVAMSYGTWPEFPALFP